MSAVKYVGLQPVLLSLYFLAQTVVAIREIPVWVVITVSHRKFKLRSPLPTVELEESEL